MSIEFHIYPKKFHNYHHTYFQLLDTIGFPIPFIAFVSKKGWLCPILSPILILQQHENERVFSLKKLPASGLYGYGRIYSYYEQDELVFLYSNGKTDATKYNIRNDVHLKIRASNSPYKRGGITNIGPELSVFLLESFCHIQLCQMKTVL